MNTSAITDGDGVTTATADSSFSVQWILVNSDKVHKDIDNADLIHLHHHRRRQNAQDQGQGLLHRRRRATMR